jgi:DNA-binding CsgD family transcriptional regulator
LIKAGLTYKEIASIMGISINGVKIARNRLRKKFELENETKTSDFIDKI